jgi:hypothetical protein
MSAVHAAELTDARSALDLFAQLFELQVAIYVEVKLTQPRLMQAAQWSEWVAQLRALQAALADRAPSAVRLPTLVNTQHRINDIVRAMFAAAPTTAG